MISALFVNLPVADVARSRAFWSGLGFSFNEQFSDEKAICLVLKPDVLYAMLLSEPFFSTFTDRPVSDRKSTQVLLAVSVNSRQEVDRLVSTALTLGATRYREAADHGWMYYDTFADPDGHQWEILFSDPSQFPGS